jgi:hypothetical protein
MTPAAAAAPASEAHRDESDAYFFCEKVALKPGRPSTAAACTSARCLMKETWNGATQRARGRNFLLGAQSEEN